jgi:hypothetical protein
MHTEYFQSRRYAVTVGAIYDLPGSVIKDVFVCPVRAGGAILTCIKPEQTQVHPSRAGSHMSTRRITARAR